MYRPSRLVLWEHLLPRPLLLHRLYRLDHSWHGLHGGLQWWQRQQRTAWQRWRRSPVPPAVRAAAAASGHYRPLRLASRVVLPKRPSVGGRYVETAHVAAAVLSAPASHAATAEPVTSHTLSMRGTRFNGPNLSSAGYVLASVLAAVCAVVTGNPAQEALRGGCDGEQRHAPWRDGPPFALKKCRFLPHWLFLPAPLVSWTRKQHTLLLLRATPQLQLSLALPPFVAFMAMWRQATGLSPSSEARI